MRHDDRERIKAIRGGAGGHLIHDDLAWLLELVERQEAELRDAREVVGWFVGEQSKYRRKYPEASYERVRALGEPIADADMAVEP